MVAGARHQQSGRIVERRLRIRQRPPSARPVVPAVRRWPDRLIPPSAALFAGGRGTRVTSTRSQTKRRREMRKGIAELDAEQRAALLQVVDLATAICASALIVSVLKFVVDLLS